MRAAAPADTSWAAPVGSACTAAARRLARAMQRDRPRNRDGGRLAREPCEVEAAHGVSAGTSPPSTIRPNPFDLRRETSSPRVRARAGPVADRGHDRAARPTRTRRRRTGRRHLPQHGADRAAARGPCAGRTRAHPRRDHAGGRALAQRRRARDRQSGAAGRRDRGPILRAPRPVGRRPSRSRSGASARQRGSSLSPIRNASTECAACRPSRIAQTTSDWPRRMSPAANTFGTLVA